MRGICQLCGRQTNLSREVCSNHYNYYPAVPRQRRRYRSLHKFDPEPIKRWIKLNGHVKTVCDKAGIPSRFFYRDHKLQANTVDRYCCALGIHPAVLYGDDWWAA